METDQLKIVRELTSISSHHSHITAAKVAQPVATFVGVACSISFFFFNNSCYCNETDRVSQWHFDSVSREKFPFSFHAKEEAIGCFSSRFTSKFYWLMNRQIDYVTGLLFSWQFG